MRFIKMLLLSHLICDTSNSATLTFEKWKSENTRITIGGLEVSYRVVGKGPWLTLIHGFPTSSLDWAKILPQLSEHFTVLVFDFIGFGDSSKPKNYNYSTSERADLVENLWEALGVDSTSVVAHDFGATVLLELLYRSTNKALSTKIKSTVFLNGGLFTDLHKPLIAQKLLMLPYLGAVFNKFITYDMFNKQLRSSLGIQLEETELEEMWKSIKNRNGLRNYYKLIHYISDRQENRDQWEPLVSADTIPKKFIWGLKDPISGAHMIEEVVRRNPKAVVCPIPNVGHFPQLEDPETVAAEILNWAI